MNFCLRIFALFAAGASILSAQDGTARPNIVFIMADDLGPGWVDYDDSNPEVNTPKLPRLAEGGMVLTKAYAACSVCSPTRAVHYRHVTGTDRNDNTHPRKGRQ
ncbi:MAG: arylsulfatase A [Verrucomicrobiales bacterium]|jgi:arylsulfatase A